jgi:alpha-beta hydrolase superfamily lysophospholipase
MTKAFIASLALLAPWVASAETSGASETIEEIVFESRGSKLAGSLVIPKGAPPRAAVVFVHGSGKQSRDVGLAKWFASAGIAAFVYDKRGAGASGGTYEGEQSVSEKNIDLLAADAAAAAKALASHPAMKGIPVGIAGISQAGWIAPLAAERSGARFLVLWSAPVCKVSEEDIYSQYTADKDARVAPAYQVALLARKEKYVWPAFLGKDPDPNESLGRLTIPGLWIFSDNDGSVPVDLSIARLQTLRAAGHRYDYALFSGLGHNNMDGTFATATDWIRRLASR